ncbi:hypothetical protein ACJ72_08423 [Emergomyces africanus]|uniref:Uncharacterized protein n=1 Tax=Emergomyces africanus TaxID=1955775 RepID=A0A1B7NKA6_9EURO|nr:hypothetical protein ACJ72_08423 [Emergomyces africanus]
MASKAGSVIGGSEVDLQAILKANEDLIVSHLDWDDEALAASYYQELKDEIKDKIA